MSQLIKTICYIQGITAGHYKAGQVGVKVKHIEMIKDLTSDLTVTVDCDETYCHITPGQS